MNIDKENAAYTEKGIPLSDLKEIYHLCELDLRLHIDKNAELYWNLGQDRPKPLASIPPKVQVLFYVKFIQDHELADRVKFIADPIVCIEMYIKAKFLLRADLDIS